MTAPTDPTLAFDASAVPPPDRAAKPDGFVVEVPDGTRIHFLDWGGPTNHAARPDAPGVLLIHGLAQTAWSWTPVARRLRAARRTVAMDLRGHGLSDAPIEGYDPDTLASDAVEVAAGSGAWGPDGEGPIVLAGHGFGAIVAAWLGATLGDRCAGVVLVDGGWEDVARTTGLEPEEFLRGLDEPPEVLRSMTAFLADRRGFDPATWDDDQEQAARSIVVETYSKRLTPATRPHAIAGAVAAMFAYHPAVVLPSIEAPLTVLRAANDEEGTHARSLGEAQAALEAAGRPRAHVATFPDAGHNLMRYRPLEVTAAILSAASTLRP